MYREKNRQWYEWERQGISVTASGYSHGQSACCGAYTSEGKSAVPTTSCGM
eukprot:COSAG01_NODE_26616_length_708_cov_0.954023_1_plen_50_part_10